MSAELGIHVPAKRGKVIRPITFTVRYCVVVEASCLDNITPLIRDTASYVALCVGAGRRSVDTDVGVWSLSVSSCSPIQATRNPQTRLVKQPDEPWGAYSRFPPQSHKFRERDHILPSGGTAPYDQRVPLALGSGEVTILERTAPRTLLDLSLAEVSMTLRLVLSRTDSSPRRRRRASRRPAGELGFVAL